MKSRNHDKKNLSFLVLVAVLVAFFCYATSTTFAEPFSTAMPTIVDPRYKISVLVSGSDFHGIHGLTFDSLDTIYTGSVAGQTIYKVCPETGKIQVYVGPPYGVADDLEFGPDGRLYWTTMPVGKVYCKSADGAITTLAEGLPGTNALAFNQEGRLFVSQVFMGDALWEIDLSGGKNNRKVAESLGGLNGFDFGPDGKIYGPLWFKRAVARVDPESGQIEVVADGFQVPAAANFDSKGNLYVVDSAAGEVIRVDVKTGEKTLVAKVDPSIDNLAINSKDRLFITNMANNGIYEIDTNTGKARTVVEGKLACPGGIAVTSENGSDTLHLADLFSYRKVDGFTGKFTTVARSLHAAGPYIVEYPMSVSIQGNTVILTSWFTGSVQEMDRVTGESKRVLHGFKAPSHALMMTDGSLIVAEMVTGSLLKVTGEKEEDRTVIAKGLIVPTYLSFISSDAVFVTEYLAGTVARIDLGSGEKTIVASGLSMPEGIAVNTDGKLLVVETGTRMLTEIDPATGAVKPIAINLAAGMSSFPGGAPPGVITGVAVSDSGSIYVTGDIENVIYKITPK